MGYIIRCDGVLSHSTGPWKKHKYLRKEGKRYVYARSSAGGLDSYNKGRAFGKKAATLLAKIKSKWFSVTTKANAAFNDYVAKGKDFAKGFANSFAYENTERPGANQAAATAVSATGKKTHSAYAEKKAKSPAATATTASGKKTHSYANEQRVKGQTKNRAQATLAYPELQRKTNSTSSKTSTVLPSGGRTYISNTQRKAAGLATKKKKAYNYFGRKPTKKKVNNYFGR